MSNNTEANKTLTLDQFFANCQTMVNGRSRYLRACSAGVVNDLQHHGFKRFPIYVGFQSRGVVVKTSRDRNGINLFIVMVNGTKDLRNVNPNMNLFMVEIELDTDLTDSNGVQTEIGSALLAKLEELRATF